MIGSFENEILEVGVCSGRSDTVFLFNEIDGSEEVHRIIPINYTGYINTNGKYVLKPEYLIHFNWEFKEYQWLEVVKNGKHGIINKDKKFLVPVRYDKFNGIHNNYIIAQKNGKWGLIDSTNKIKLKFKYQQLKNHGEGLLAKRSNLWGYITFEGNSAYVFDPHTGQVDLNSLIGLKATVPVEDQDESQARELFFRPQTVIDAEGNTQTVFIARDNRPGRQN